MLERLCHLKPTINNRKMQEQRQQELKYLKLIGKHSSHHIAQNPTSSHDNTNSFRASHQSQRQRAQRVKTENFKASRAEDFTGDSEFNLHQRPKYISSHSVMQLRPRKT